jgi:RND family efflux transporter MFP subunit
MVIPMPPLRSLPALVAILAVLPLALPVRAETAPLAPVAITEWKAVYGRVEARDHIPARARLGGTLVELAVAEGDEVAAGQELARIVDDKLDFQLAALAAQRAALTAQLANAQADLARGEELLKTGITTAQRVDALRTQVDVLDGQIAALDAQADVVAQQVSEGRVLAPVAGRVLDVPVAEGGVVLPGEPIAVIGGGGTFLRIAVPERHALALTEGAAIRIADGAGEAEGRLARIYPLIENGRVIADVEIAGLSDRFVGVRMLVRLPVGQRQALVVPADTLVTRSGLDFVGLQTAAGVVLRAVVPGQRQTVDGIETVEILTGLRDGDIVVPASAAGQGEAHGAAGE